MKCIPLIPGWTQNEVEASMPREIFLHTAIALSSREPRILLCWYLCSEVGAAVSLLQCVQPERVLASA